MILLKPFFLIGKKETVAFAAPIVISTYENLLAIGKSSFNTNQKIEKGNTFSKDVALPVPYQILETAIFKR